MNEKDRIRIERRRVLKVLGGTAATLPLASLISACSSEEPPPPAAEPPAEVPPEPAAAEPAAPEAATPEASPEPEPAAELVPLSEDDPQAQSLGYVNDASTVDADQFPQYQPGRLCSNCALYQGGDAAEGGCPIFPGKLVKASGWCNVWAAAS